MKIQIMFLVIRTIFAAGLIATSALDVHAAPPKQPEKSVSIFAVLSAPVKFDGAHISVEGFVNIAPENAAIYISSEARRFALTSYAIWINVAALDKERIKYVNRKCCRITGTYHYDASETLGGFIGRIEVQNIQVIEEEYIDQRDALVMQLGYINGMLLENREKLSEKEIAELERRRKDISDLLTHFEEARDGGKR